MSFQLLSSLFLNFFVRLSSRACAHGYWIKARPNVNRATKFESSSDSCPFTGFISQTRNVAQANVFKISDAWLFGPVHCCASLMAVTNAHGAELQWNSIFRLTKPLLFLIRSQKPHVSSSFLDLINTSFTLRVCRQQHNRNCYIIFVYCQVVLLWFRQIQSWWNQK